MSVTNFFNNSIIPKISHSVSLFPTCGRLIGIFKDVLGVNLVYNLFDEGLAKFLCLETLRHGTGPYNYLSIYLNGTNPKLASNSMTKVFNIKRSKNYFYVVRDSEYMKRFHKSYKLSFSKFYLPKITTLPISEKSTLSQKLNKVIIPRKYALFSGLSHIAPSMHQSITISKTKLFFSLVSSILTPTVKFRFTLEDVHKNMEKYELIYAYRTSKAIGLKHIGIIGTLSQGINLNMFSRMAANPLKVIKGISLMTLSYFVTSCFLLKASFYTQLINSNFFLHGLDKVTKVALYSITLLGIS